ncbi:MAG TPA: GYD domain-containing protein [Pirellulales bacterium]|nr:GYD domain-containing protein [Pirellulales bacterium]
MGAEVKNIFWSLGPFDGCIVFDVPDDKTATALMLQLGSFANVQTQTARAYQAAEMEQIVAKMSG